MHVIKQKDLAFFRKDLAAKTGVHDGHPAELAIVFTYIELDWFCLAGLKKWENADQ